MKRKLHILVAALLALGMVGMAGISSARPTYAATDVVTTCAASGTGSLPAVVAAAAAGDTITFNQDCSGANAIKMGTSGAFQPIEINKDLTIDGTGHTIVVDGGNKTRLFDVDPGVNVPVVHLIGLTLSNGTCPGCDGGAIFSNEGTVIIANSTLSGNSATEDTVNYFGGCAGAIENLEGSLTIANSTLSGNSASSCGGAVESNSGSLTITNSTLSGNSAGEAGAIFNTGFVPETIANSTFSGNSATANGGAIVNGGTITIINSTLSGNSVSAAYLDTGEAIYNRGVLYIGGSIVAGDNPGNCYSPNPSSSVIYDEGYNLEWTGSANTSTGYTCGLGKSVITGGPAPIGDIIGIDPQLGALQNNGGPTQTRALLTGGPAIDQIPTGTSFTANNTTYTLCPSSGTTTDQRGAGYPRPDSGEANCDMGAYEYQDVQVPTFTFALPAGFSKTYGDDSFSVAGYASKTSGDTGAITFATDASSVGCSVTSDGEVTITGATTGTGTCTIDASLAADPSYSAVGPTSQSFSIAKKSLTVTASHDAVSYGDPAPDGFTIGYTGWAGTDSATSGAISGSPNCSVPSYAAGDVPGSYDITCTAGDLSADNYTFVDGTGTALLADGSTAVALGSLTVGKQTTSIDAVSGSGIYAGSATLVATLKDAAGHGLAGKTVSFSINGTAVCGGSTGVTCPTTANGANGATTGQATLTGVSLSGIEAGSHSGWVSASFGNDTNYADSTASGELNVGKASETIALSNLSQTYDGTAKSVTVTTTPSGLSGVSVTYTGSGTTTYGPSITAPTNAGNYSVDASLADDNYVADDATGTLTISAGSQSISFALPAGFSKTYGDLSFSVAGYASATSGLAVSFSSTTTSVCTVSGSTVIILAVGTCTLNASQPGNGNYNAAQNVSQSFSIAKAGTTTTVTPSVDPSILKQGVTFTVTVTSGAGTPSGTVTIKDGATTLASGIQLSATGSATLTTSALAAGTHSITASYSGSANFSSSVTSTPLSQQVRYNVKVLSAGSLTIVLQLLDYNNTNVSASKLTVTAECVVPYSQTPPAACGATPVQTITKAFGFSNSYKGMGPAYSYSVNSHGLTKGQQYDLLVQTDGDPIWHAVPFTA